MRALRLDAPAPAAQSPLHTVDLPDPEPGPGEIAIDVTACGVCRTDLQVVEGDLEPRRLPLIPGHQVVGRVSAVGPGVTDWQVGDRAGVAWLAGTCGSCRFCTSGRENLCERSRFTGWDRDGGYSTRTVASSDFAFPLPAGRSDLEIAPLLCGGVIGYRALKVAGIRPGGRLGLYGFGASAILTIQIAAHWGCEVFVVSRSEPERERARELGAVWAGSYFEVPPVPLDAAITFAPVGDVAVAALRALDRGGVLAINAIHLDRIPEFDYDRLWWERQVRSVANFTRADAREYLGLAARIGLRTVVDPRPFEEANRTLADLKDGRVAGAAVLTVG
jgi:propanol-preferring alcohol dehydrogenase